LWVDFWLGRPAGREIFERSRRVQISTLNRVDTRCCFSYTYPVVLRPLGLVVEGKSSDPGTVNDGMGIGRAAEMGRQPRKAVLSLSVIADAVHSLG
jgi:hypothetical protein